MPPRIPGAQRLGTFSLCIRPALQPATAASRLPVTQTASMTYKEKKRMSKQNPQGYTRLLQRINAHRSRKEVIVAERETLIGDPIRGFTTPFIESLDSAGQEPLSTPEKDADGNPIEEPHALPTSSHVLNHLIDRSELESAINRAYHLTKPAESPVRDGLDPAMEQEARQRHDELHANAVEALNRITDLENGSAKDRLHANIRRCVETFGRHQTDQTLRPKPLSRGQEDEEKPVRAGPDTGSSEVQIAILTTKIRALADELARGRGYKDKMGNRNLRLLTHRRQRLIRYMERKEKGSDRWKHMVETLGLSTATYKGQISF